MADDPRGHDDGDVVVDAKERPAWLLAQLEAFLLDLAQSEGYGPDELAAACLAAAQALKSGARHG